MASTTEKPPNCLNKTHPALRPRVSSSERDMQALNDGLRKLALCGNPSPKPTKQCVYSDSAAQQQAHPRRTEEGASRASLPSAPVRVDIAVEDTAAPIVATCKGKPLRAWYPGVATHGMSMVRGGEGRQCLSATSPPMLNLQFSSNNRSARPDMPIVQSTTPPLISRGLLRNGGAGILPQQARLAKCKSESSLRVAGSALEAQRRRVVEQLMGELKANLARALRTSDTPQARVPTSWLRGNPKSSEGSRVGRCSESPQASET
ncbi:hypothetical protein B0T16DRAFT_224331 [Cercophora newfieldiana]|uniref:Uncharacterized protein n=1 Tax=Cercophora newfieldiana TaxID=92897 RepID=A0AA40CK97_9PEZI|nr:hypothetical protein B0T16DRAFT_224331 [Cercophora newfieldiana]